MKLTRTSIGLLSIYTLGFLISCNNNTQSENDVIVQQTEIVDIKNEKNTGINNDVNIIEEIAIGSQVWTARNLDVSTFRNGDPIQEATTKEEWEKAAKLHIPAWCYYENNSENGKSCGKLYNWFAVMDERGLAPIGYHIPNKKEFWTLLNHLGCDYHSSTLQKHNTANKLRSLSNLWKNNEYSTNESGFNALPCGLRYDFGGFNDINEKGHWWSTSGYGSLQEGYSPSDFSIDDWADGPGASVFGAGTGLSVRCLKGEGNDSTIKIPIIDSELIEYDENEKPKQGEWTVTLPNGSKISKHFKDGLEEGERITYNAYGNKASRGDYKNGLQDGQWVSYVISTYDDSRIAEKGNYVGGKKEGEWLFFNNRGETDKKENYKDGLLEGEQITYQSDGNVYEKKYYVKGSREGEWTEYYDDGKIRKKEHFLNDKWTGETVEYGYSGKINHKLVYSDGLLIKNIMYDENGNER